MSNGTHRGSYDSYGELWPLACETQGFVIGRLGDSELSKREGSKAVMFILEGRDNKDNMIALPKSTTFYSNHHFKMTIERSIFI